MKMKLNRRTLGIVCIVLALILISPQFAFADADTTDGDNEVFYEWVEAYVNFHDSEWDWDTYSDGSHKEQIDFIIFNAPAATSDVVENLAEGIISGNGSWRINNYYTGNDAEEEDWVYWDRAPYNIETADIAIWGGHGPEGKACQFNNLSNDPFFTQYDADFGYNDLDWVFLFTCNWLRDRYSRVYPAKLLGGAHIVCGYGSTMYMDPRMGTYLASLLTRGWNVVEAWHEMNYQYPGPNTSSSNPTISIAYGAKKDENDCIWNEGGVGPYPGNNPDPFWSQETITTIRPGTY